MLLPNIAVHFITSPWKINSKTRYFCLDIYCIYFEDSCFYLQAAHAVLQLQETGKPVYKVKNVSLNALCELYNAPVNPMKEQVRQNIVD